MKKVCGKLRKWKKMNQRETEQRSNSKAWVCCLPLIIVIVLENKRSRYLKISNSGVFRLHIKILSLGKTNNRKDLRWNPFILRTNPKYYIIYVFVYIDFTPKRNLRHFSESVKMSVCMPNSSKDYNVQQKIATHLSALFSPWRCCINPCPRVSAFTVWAIEQEVIWCTVIKRGSVWRLSAEGLHLF